MRHDLQLLNDIADFSDEVIGLTHKVSLEQFVSNDVLRSAVMYKLIVIGEAAGKLSDDIQARFPEAQWRKIVGFRNRAVHGYFATDWEIVYDVALVAIPSLKFQVENILKVI